jgi:hypothetical protein
MGRSLFTLERSRMDILMTFRRGVMGELMGGGKLMEMSYCG